MKSASKEFLKYRRQQEASIVAQVGPDASPLDSIMTVELNTTELCNRTCAFCPRVDPDVYPNRNLHMTVQTGDKVARDLASFNYKGRVSFSGFGEPTLNKSFTDLVAAVCRHLPENILDTNTNGDKLTVEKIVAFYDAGLTAIYVNMYDGPEQRPHFEAMFEAAGTDPKRYRLRPHWGGPDEDYGLILNNRSGLVTSPESGMSEVLEPIAHPCYYPFSRLLVDWNGDILLCSNDWGRAVIAGNVLEQHLGDIWMSDVMLEIRRKLMKGDRHHRPCNKCNVKGTLSGQFSFDLLIDYYKQQGLIDDEDQPMAVAAGGGA